MEELFKSEIHIFRSNQLIWGLLLHLGEYGHFWLPDTAAVIPKSLYPEQEGALFDISSFAGSGLIHIKHITAEESIELEIVFKTYAVLLKISLVPDGNGSQLNFAAFFRMAPRLRFLSGIWKTLLKRKYRNCPNRIRRLTTQAEG